MSDIDFIKYVLLKAGFRIVKDDDGDEYVYYCEPEKRWCSIESLVKDPILWPYALQRAIEGVNRSNTDFLIVQQWAVIQVGTYPSFSEWKSIDINNNIDQAKKQALKYIYEQETT